MRQLAGGNCGPLKSSDKPDSGTTGSFTTSIIPSHVHVSLLPLASVTVNVTGYTPSVSYATQASAPASSSKAPPVKSHAYVAPSHKATGTAEKWMGETWHGEARLMRVRSAMKPDNTSDGA